MQQNSENTRYHCNDCNRETKHEILFKKTRNWCDNEEDYGPTYHEKEVHILAECKGCEHITTIVTYECSYDENVYITQYPLKTIRKEPAWLSNLFLMEDLTNPVKQDFIREIYIALRNGNVRLAVIGIRALLEHIMIDKIGDKLSFDKNLRAFQEEGFISKPQKNAIEPVLEAGHASIHRGFKATMPDVLRLLDVTENIIQSIYLNQDLTTELQVPARAPRPKKTPVESPIGNALNEGKT